jgi:hypothetical protein
VPAFPYAFWRASIAPFLASPIARDAIDVEIARSRRAPSSLKKAEMTVALTLVAGRYAKVS